METERLVFRIDFFFNSLLHSFDHDSRQNNSAVIADAEYRCIKINHPNGTNDANLTAAMSAVGLDMREVLQLLPG